MNELIDLPNELLSFDRPMRRPKVGKEARTTYGGMSGNAIRPIALRDVSVREDGRAERTSECVSESVSKSESLSEWDVAILRSLMLLVGVLLMSMPMSFCCCSCFVPAFVASSFDRVVVLCCRCCVFFFGTGHRPRAARLPDPGDR